MNRLAVSVTTAMVTAAAIGLLTPKRLASQYASPVKVMNSSSGPAIGSLIDDPGRTPYFSQQGTSFGASANVVMTFPVVPPNHRLVVLHVGGYYNRNSGTAPTLAILSSPSPSQYFSEFLTPIGGGATTFDVPVLAYFDAGQQPQTSVLTLDGSPAFNSFATSTLIGYMLDCSAAPCAPVAH